MMYFSDEAIVYNDSLYKVNFYLSRAELNGFQLY